MNKYLITIAYDGTDYHGWQVQPNGVTVQQTVQDAIERILGVREDVTGCSRTDAGVHANNFCFHMQTQRTLTPFRFVGALNAVLPDDIAVKDCRPVPPEFHARYDCIGKEYLYKIWNAPQRNPFCEGRYLHYKKPLDVSFLQSQAQSFVGTHDFAAFCAAGSTVEDTVRTVEYFTVCRREEEVLLTVKADGFLYNMVRIMTGTLLELAEGKLAPDSIPEILASKNRSRAGRTAPPHGLYLNRVYYPAAVGQETGGI